MATLAHTLGDAPRRGVDMGRLGWPLFLALMAGIAVSIGWTGFIASDDGLYYQGALRWANGEAFPGDNHWTTRFPVVLTVAAMIKLVGATPLALHLTALIWFAVFVTMGIVLARRIGGERTGWFVGLLLVTMPNTALGASVVNCDLPEATFLMLGAWLLIRDPARPLLAHCLLAGLCFGLAVLSRETAVLALAGCGILFLAGRPLPRWAWLAAAGGAALVLAGEAALQWAATGDPFHRYGLALNHSPTLDRSANKAGNFTLHPVIDPLLVLLVNNEFGLLFWFAIAAAFGIRGRGFDWRRYAPVLALALGCFLLVALLSSLLPLNPRYFEPAAVAAAILVGAWLARIRPARAAMVLAVVVATNLLILSLQNDHPRWRSEALAMAAAEDPARIITSDTDTVNRAEQRLQWAGLDNVRPGAAYRLIPAAQAQGQEIVGTYPAPWRPAGAVAALAGIETDRLKAGEDMVLVRTR